MFPFPDSLQKSRGVSQNKPLGLALLRWLRPLVLSAMLLFCFPNDLIMSQDGHDTKEVLKSAATFSEIFAYNYTSR